MEKSILFAVIAAAATSFISLTAAASPESYGNHMIAKCQSEVASIFIMADTDLNASARTQKAQALVSWANTTENLESIHLYNDLKLENFGKGQIKVTGTLVLPIPIGASLNLVLELSKEKGRGNFGTVPVQCQTTPYFQQYQ